MHSIPFRKARYLHRRSITAQVWGRNRINYTVRPRLIWSRPQVNEPALSLETTIGASYRLDESLMERMMVPSTPGARPIASSRLDLQRRMHPAIADLMRATLYPFLQVRVSVRF